MIPTNNTIPYQATPVLSYAIIATCAAVFLYQVGLPAAAETKFFQEYGLVPARYSNSAWAEKMALAQSNLLPFFTCMFLHGGVLHLLSNMWTLWIFGPALEDRLGAARFAMLYVSAGLVAGLTHMVFNWSSTIPTIGASGAIAGVIGAYVRRFPYAWINVLQPVGLLPIFLYMPALMFAGIWFLMQVTQAAGSSLLPQAGGGVAWWAHIGGFIMGWWLQPRISPKPNAVEESQTALQSAFWPVREVQRWMRWMSRR